MFIPESHAWTPAQKSLIAGAIVAAVLVIGVGIYGYERYQQKRPMPGVEKIEDLGSGFRRITIAKDNKFEVNHYTFLYYRNRLICQIGASLPSLSPSGNFAICQDARSGKLILFRRRDEQTTELTKAFFGVASSFVWHEEQGTVEAVVGKEQISAVFPLQ
jgi:hypothetical protein